MRTRDANKEVVIREKAIEMIVALGFDGFSMQKLARAAAISPATLYIYYTNKEDLLNQLYNHVHKTFSERALLGFSPDMSLEEGLWVQWQNRLAYVTEYPSYYSFHEQFRHSPLVNHSDVAISVFKENMKAFLKNAIERGEMKRMEPEIFWSLAYGSFYTLLNFHQQKRSMMDKPFTLTEEKLRQAFEMVIKGLKP